MDAFSNEVSSSCSPATLFDIGLPFCSITCVSSRKRAAQGSAHLPSSNKVHSSVTLALHGGASLRSQKNSKPSYTICSMAVRDFFANASRELVNIIVNVDCKDAPGARTPL